MNNKTIKKNTERYGIIGVEESVKESEKGESIFTAEIQL
jgi:hypothetical protein